jgi:Ca2+-binding EF-hand superfamily protein
LSLLIKDLQALFSIYDQDQSGSISYKEFSANLFGQPVSGSSSFVGSGNESPEVLAEVMKTKLASRGARGIVGLQRQFKIMDDDGSKSLNKYEFIKACSDYGLGFSKEDLAALFTYFDVDNSNCISYDEFLRAIRGPMNINRKKVVA